MGAELWAVVGTLSFWGWVGAFLVGIFSSFSAQGEFRSKLALLWGTLALVSGILTVLALLKAP